MPTPTDTQLEDAKLAREEQRQRLLNILGGNSNLVLKGMQERIALLELIKIEAPQLSLDEQLALLPLVPLY